MRRICLLLLLTAVAGCADAATATSTEVRTVHQSVGEPVDGFPSWAERVAWVWTNRARQDPQTELADCDACADKACYTPKPPVTWGHELGRAARFHSDNLVNNGLGIQHDSPCDLVGNIDEIYPDECNGEAACACQGGALGCEGDCPRFTERLGLFSASPNAENIHSTGNPVSAIRGFVHEPYDVSECGRDYDSMGRPNGHRVGVLEHGPSVGIGIGEGGRILTMDFGGGGGAPAKVVSGVHYPETGAQLEFRANWYDDAAPVNAVVNVEGECTAMTVERGTPENGTFLVESAVPSECARYRFEFEDSAGAISTFPETGSFGIGCSEEYLSDPPPECGCSPQCASKVCGDDGCGSTCGVCAEGEMCDGTGACVVPDDNNSTRTNNESPNNESPNNSTANNSTASPNNSTAGTNDPSETGGTGLNSDMDDEGTDIDVEGTGHACSHVVAAPRTKGAWLFLGALFVWYRRRS